MARKRKQEPESPPEYTTAMAMRDLEAMGREGNPSTIWHTILKVSHQPDFPVLLDFVVETGLATPLETPMEARNGDAARHSSWIHPIDGSEMIWIPGGSCKLGQKKVKVHLPGFALGRYPVTNEQFHHFVGQTDYLKYRTGIFLKLWANDRPKTGEEKHPVTDISFLDALNYCRWAGLTLPTEWMWEKSARGVDGRSFPWGEQRGARLRSLCKPYYFMRTSVGSNPKTRTAYGCEDLIGNVGEWCYLGEKDYSILSLPVPRMEVPASACVRSHMPTLGDSIWMAEGGESWRQRRVKADAVDFTTGFRVASVLPIKVG